MNARSHRYRTLALGAALGAIAVGAFALVTGDRDPAAAAANANAQRVVEETKTQRSGGFAYVKTTFPVAANVGRFAQAFCPRGSQLTGGFGWAGVSSNLESAGLPVVLVRRDGGDKGKVADNGIRLAVTNPTSMTGEGEVDAICEFTKKRRR